MASEWIMKAVFDVNFGLTVTDSSITTVILCQSNWWNSNSESMAYFPAFYRPNISDILMKRFDLETRFKNEQMCCM